MPEAHADRFQLQETQPPESQGPNRPRNGSGTPSRVGYPKPGGLPQARRATPSQAGYPKPGGLPQAGRGNPASWGLSGHSTGVTHTPAAFEEHKHEANQNRVDNDGVHRCASDRALRLRARAGRPECAARAQRARWLAPHVSARPRPLSP
ncbi:hypothetical protein GCM10020360_09730 [Nonlabens tegetincola]